MNMLSSIRGLSALTSSINKDTESNTNSNSNSNTKTIDQQLQEQKKLKVASVMVSNLPCILCEHCVIIFVNMFAAKRGRGSHSGESLQDRWQRQ
jgi:ATP-dependent Zn protease